MAIFTNNGTAANPAITNTNDTNTGIFYPAADTVGISTGGVERIRVDNSGIVGYYNKANILGTVSESGGVPTGAVFESGSNANGSFVRYANGTMICTHSGFLFSSLQAGTQNSGFTDSVTLTFASGFSATPVVVPAISTANAIVGVSGRSSTNCTLALHLVATTQVLQNAYVAIGRWF